MNFQELEAKILEITVEKFANEDFDHTLLPEHKLVHEEGDTEGGGDHSEKVYHFADSDIYAQVTGYYSSYNGTDWNESVKQVFPQQETITVYKADK